eukprot:15089284-Ditylum_brightwellii.AAC.1
MKTCGYHVILTPPNCIHDNGGKFIGEAFQRMLQRNGIQDSPTTSHNPQANAVCKRLHQTVANVLQTTTNNQANSYQQAVRAVDNALATAMHTTHCTVSRMLSTLPGVLVFRRDMILDIPVMSDLISIRDKWQQLIDKKSATTKYEAQRV